MPRGTGLIVASLVAGALGLLAGFASGCTAGFQRPYEFQTKASADASSTVIQALADLEWPASPSEDNPNKLRTDWKSTGVRYGYAGGRPAKLVRRFLVEMTPAGAKLKVQVKIELLACSEVAMLAGEYRAGRDCNLVEDLRPEDHQEVERVGKAIEKALAER